MLRLAFLSDIHGNIQALTTVLGDLDAAGADLIVCGGDLVGYGASPNEVVETIRTRRIPTIMGNYDEGVGFDKPDCGCAYRDPAQAERGAQSLAWTKRTVTAANKEYLRGLLSRLELTAHGRKVLIVHGSPRRINEYLFVDRPEDSLARLFADERADIIICGHTHLPYVRRIGDRILINTGSAGKPKDGDPRAGYVRVRIDENSVQTEIRRIRYDVEGAARAIERTDLPSDFAAALRRGG